MERDDLIREIFKKASRKAPSMFSSTPGYYHVNPTPITMDDGSVVNVEWVQPSYFGSDVLINYRTDKIFTTKLSVKELEQVLAAI